MTKPPIDLYGNHGVNMRGLKLKSDIADDFLPKGANYQLWALPGPYG
jgi:hypothetical protein